MYQVHRVGRTLTAVAVNVAVRVFSRQRVRDALSAVGPVSAPGSITKAAVSPPPGRSVGTPRHRSLHRRQAPPAGSPGRSLRARPCSNTCPRGTDLLRARLPRTPLRCVVVDRLLRRLPTQRYQLAVEPFVVEAGAGLALQAWFRGVEFAAGHVSQRPDPTTAASSRTPSGSSPAVAKTRPQGPWRSVKARRSMRPHLARCSSRSSPTTAPAAGAS